MIFVPIQIFFPFFCFILKFLTSYLNYFLTVFSFDQEIHINQGPNLVLAVTLFPRRTQWNTYQELKELKQYANYNLTFGPKP